MLNPKMIAIFALFATVTAAQPASAQSPSAAAAQQQQQKVTVSKEAIREFAGLQKQVESVRTEYQQKLKNADSTQKSEQLTAEANQKMVQIIESSALELQDYNLIASLLPYDKNLQEMYLKYTQK